jgi:small subunit ribosomal protein S18
MADENAPSQAPPPAAPAAPAAPSGGHGHSGPGGPSGPGGGPGGRPQGRPGGPAKRGKRSFVRKKKVCRFCVDKADFIDYKKAEILAPFIQERGKILPRRMTGTCARHQRWLTVAIKRAQNIALLPFAAEL